MRVTSAAGFLKVTVEGWEVIITRAKGVGVAIIEDRLTSKLNGGGSVGSCDFAQYFLQTVNKISPVIRTTMIMATGNENGQWSVMNGYLESSIFCSNWHVSNTPVIFSLSL
jgi:hypothetical protein